MKIWARSVAGVWMRRLIIAFGCKRKDGCQCDGRMSYPHRGTKKAVHLKAMLALPFKFECPPRRMPHSEEPFSLHFPHFPGWTTKTIFVPFWFGHDLDNESRDGSAPQLLVSSHRDPLWQWASCRAGSAKCSAEPGPAYQAPWMSPRTIFLSNTSLKMTASTLSAFLANT